MPRPLLAALVLAVATSAHAEKIVVDDDTFFNIGALIQPQLTVTEEGAPGGDVGTDIYLRRARFILGGQLDSHISFIFVTDQPSWGKNGDYTPAFIVQDAVAAYRFSPAVTVSAGFMLLPFLRNNYQSAGALNALDYRAGVIKFPTGRAFRDMGLELRGLLFNDRLYYRAGVFSGVAGKPAATGSEAINDADAPRFTGTIRFNLAGKEDAYAVPGIYFASEPIVSVGFGGDWQHEALGTTGRKRYLAYDADVFFDVPIGADMELAGQAAVVRYDSYQSGTIREAATAFYLEAGYRFRKIEPVVSLEWFDGEDTPRVLNLRFGLNLWVARHAFNVKAELLVPSTETVDGVEAADNLVGTVQAQVSF